MDSYDYLIVHMDRFLKIHNYKDSWVNASERMEKLPRPPNGFKYCVRKIGLNVYGVNTSGHGSFQFYNDKSADTPIATTSRKNIGSLSVSLDDTNKQFFKEPDKDFPRGSLILNEVYITFYFNAGAINVTGSPYIILELIPCSQIEQLKADLLASD